MLDEFGLNVEDGVHLLFDGFLYEVAAVKVDKRLGACPLARVADQRASDEGSVWDRNVGRELRRFHQPRLFKVKVALYGLVL